MGRRELNGWTPVDLSRSTFYYVMLISGLEVLVFTYLLNFFLIPPLIIEKINFLSKKLIWFWIEYHTNTFWIRHE